MPKKKVTFVDLQPTTGMSRMLGVRQSYFTNASQMASTISKSAQSRWQQMQSDSLAKQEPHWEREVYKRNNPMEFTTVRGKGRPTKFKDFETELQYQSALGKWHFHRTGGSAEDKRERSMGQATHGMFLGQGPTHWADDWKPPNK